MLNDIRFAVRSLLRRPGSTAVGVAALALGIGANAAILGFIQGIVLKPLPYPDADRIVDLSQTDGLRSTRRTSVSPRDLEDFRTLETTFSGLAGYARDGRNVSFAGSPERMTGLLVEPNYLDVLGVAPALGRGLVAGEDTAGRDDVVVISHRVFERRFGSSSEALKQSLIMDGRAYRIVGVMPRSFRTPDELAAIWTVDYIAPGVLPDGVRRNRGEHILNVVGRLRPGVTLAQANAAVAARAEALAKAEPATNKDTGAMVRGGAEIVSGPLQTPLFLLFGASGLIFVIAAVNVASLLAARAVDESREVAVRVAIGASRGRVIRESLSRSVVLALAGCGAGLAVASAAQRLLRWAAPERTPRLEEVSIDATVVVAAAVVSILGAAVFGLLPALAASRARATEALRSGARSGSGRDTRQGRNVLVAAEIALAVIPLVGATLLIRSIQELRAVDLGFETARVLVANLPLPERRYATPESRFAFFEAVSERVRALPGVEAVGYANRFPMRGGWTSGILLDGGGETAKDAAFQAVGGDYFRALGMTLLRGRALDATDAAQTPPVAVVNQTFANLYLSSRADPIGGRFRRGRTAPWIEVVGIVSDIRRDGPASPVEPQAYLAAGQTGLYPVRLSDIALRATVPPLTLTKSLEAAVLAVDAEQPLTNVRTLAETYEGAAAQRRFQALLLALFAALAVALAMVGVYGIVSSTFARRTSEIGLRMALGAGASDVGRMILRESLGPAVLGLALGLLGSLALARGMRELLFGVSPFDPVTFAFVAAALLVVVFIASGAPAMRAASIQPSTALRDE